MEILVIGISHRTAPVEVRERVALPGESAFQLLETLRAEKVAREALILDTCNRTEFYLVRQEPRDDPLPHLLAHIGRLKAAPVSDISAFYRYAGLECVRHVLRVAASLDSQVVGEEQILGQVKDAYRLALRARTARFILNRLLHRAFRVARRVRAETGIGMDGGSIPQAAVQLAQEELGALDSKVVLVVGAGRTGELAARSALSAPAGRLIVANRSVQRAKQLCEALAADQQGPSTVREHGMLECTLQPDSSRKAIEWAGLDQTLTLLGQTDVAVFATSAREPILSDAGLPGAWALRDRPLLILDLAVPRSVDPRVAELPQVTLRTLDDLKAVVKQNAERRLAGVPLAETIVAEEAFRFSRWLDGLRAVPTIKLLRQHFELLRQAELESHRQEFAKQDRERLDRFTQHLCKILLHRPTSFLRHLADERAGRELEAMELVRRMFGLGAPEAGE